MEHDLQSEIGFVQRNCRERIYVFGTQFYAPLCAETISTTNYELEYSSALESDNFYGTQFHPEKVVCWGENFENFFLN